MTYLFLFTIGPVQSFIAQARKTQDLYAGSRILSDLIYHAMWWATNEWKNHNNVSIIYPYFTSKEKGSYPNRFVTQYSGDDVREFGEALKCEVYRFFHEGIVYKSIGKEAYKVCEHQIIDFLEIYWVAVSSSDNYQESMTRVEKELAAIKNYRAFKQLPLPESGRKCALNGFYNALFYCKTAKDGDDVGRKKHLDAKCKIFESNDNLSKLQAGEGLCGISFVKRKYSNAPSFDSTADIALMHTINTLQRNEEGKKALEDFAKHFDKNLSNMNGQLFFRENLNYDYLTSQGENNKDIHVALRSLDKIEQLAGRESLKLHRYYAMLVFDADNMGKKISSCQSIDAHKKLSEKLVAYAACAKRIIDNKYGKSIYAGGDDFLGMLTLRTIFCALKDLRQKFADDFEEELTFSAGVCIAHYKTPLGEVLNYARSMEKKAKKHRDEKDCLGIAVLKHSGEIHETILPWKIEDKWITEILSGITKELDSNFSPKFIKQLNKEVAIWETKAADKKFPDISKHEIRRLVERQKKGTAGDADALSSEIQTIYDYTSAISNSTEYFINALNVCDFINRKF